MLKTAIIIPTINRPKDLATTLDSVLSQTARPEQIIIVDQSSDDLTKHVVSAYREQGLSLVYEKLTSPSSAQARNHGISHLANDIDVVLFLDDDVTLAPDFIEQVDAFMGHNKEVLGILPHITTPSRTTGILKRVGQFLLIGSWSAQKQIVAKTGFNALFMEQPESPLHVQRIGGCGLIVHMSILQDGYRFPDTFLKYSIMEDVFFTYSLYKKNHTALMYVPTIKMIHHESPHRSIPNYQKIRQHCIHRYLFHKKFHLSMVGYVWTMCILSLADLITYRRWAIIKEYWKTLFYIRQNRDNISLDTSAWNSYIFRN